MRRFVTSSMIFVLFFSLCYPVYLFICDSIPVIHLPNLTYTLGGYGHLHSRLEEINEFKDVDILFLGSSHAYRGFDVRVFTEYGFKTFNLGSSSQTPIQTQLLLKRYLNYLNPKLVIYAIAPDIFTSDGVESAIDIISNSKPDYLSLQMIVKINNLKVYNTLILGGMRELLNTNDGFSQQIREGTPDYFDTYISGGYVEKNTNRFYNTKNNYEESEHKIEETINNFKQYQLNAFSQIIKDFSNRNIKYILVVTPVVNNIINNNFDYIIQQYGGYYDFNKILDFSDNYFYDANHLRQEGVEIFSTCAAELVISLGILN